MTESRIPEGEAPRWLDRPRNVDKVYWTLWLICALLLPAELFLHRHGLFSWEAVFGFYAAFGFASGLVVILGAKGLRRLIGRREDYYDG